MIPVAIRLAGLFGFNLSPLIAGAIVYSLAAGALAGVVIKIRRDGYARAIADIAAQDKGAIDAASKGRATFRACVDSGGVWDTTSGKCQRG